MLGAFDALPPGIRAPWEKVRPLIEVVGNYPDLFDDPGKSDEARAAIDPDWRRYCRFPEGWEGPSLHQWPHTIDEQPRFEPIVRHWLSEAVSAYRSGDFEGFLKFIGCLSHHEGDVTQPAHLLGLVKGMVLLKELVPPPPHWTHFNYHVDLEAVTGECGGLEAARLLGTGVEEAAWRLCAFNTQAVREMKRYIVPTLQAIFAQNNAEAERLAGPPVTLAAQLTLDLWYTAIRLARGDVSDSESKTLDTLDLREWQPDGESHDLVYGGGAILDASSRIPPYPGPMVPATLRFEGGIRAVRGLGVLPNSGLAGPRECWMRYNLPPGVFARFEAIVGLHAELAASGGADFVVELDGCEVWHSGRRTGSDFALPVAVPLGKSRTLELKVRDANEGRTFWDNHAIWAFPNLVKTDRRPCLKESKN